MIDIETLRMRLEYNPKNGHLLHKTLDESSGLRASYISRHNKIYAGFLATCKNHKTGYLIVTVNGKKMSAARVAWMLYHGSPPPDGQYLTFKNGNIQDLRIDNLKVKSTMPTGLYARTILTNYGDTIRFNMKLTFKKKCELLENDGWTLAEYLPASKKAIYTKNGIKRIIRPAKARAK
jgi:hypothetical protein